MATETTTLEVTAANIRSLFCPSVKKLTAISPTTKERVPLDYQDGNRSSSWKLLDTKGNPMLLVVTR